MRARLLRAPAHHPSVGVGLSSVSATAGGPELFLADLPLLCHQICHLTFEEKCVGVFFIFIFDLFPVIALT